MTTANINSKDVMALRERTGLGMMDCKAALIESNGDMAAAEQKLREKLKGKMDTRTDRAAGEGCIAVAVVGSKAAICEVRAETDFTARNPEFRDMAHELAKMAAAGAAGAAVNTDAMKKRLDEVRIKTGENLSFGGGIHFCVGAELARLEGEIALKSLVARFPHMQIDTASAQWRQEGFMFRGLTKLDVSW